MLREKLIKIDIFKRSKYVLSELNGGDGGGGNWLVRMEWRPAGWSVCLPLLIFPCTIKSRSSLLAVAHPGGPGKRAVKWLWCGGELNVHTVTLSFYITRHSLCGCVHAKMSIINVIFTARCHATVVYAVVVSCPSSRCSTEMAKCRITQTMPHDSQEL